MDKETPYYILINDDYIIGTPKGIAESNRTVDIHFYKFALDYELQKSLNLLSAIRLKPDIGYSPKDREEIYESVSFYLASFYMEDYEKTRKYLLDNGVLRILYLNKEDHKMDAEELGFFRSKGGN